MNYDQTQIIFSEWLMWPIEQVWPLRGGVMFNGQTDDINDLHHRILQSEIVNDFVISESETSITMLFAVDEATLLQKIELLLNKQ